MKKTIEVEIAEEIIASSFMKSEWMSFKPSARRHIMQKILVGLTEMRNYVLDEVGCEVNDAIEKIDNDILSDLTEKFKLKPQHYEFTENITKPWRNLNKLDSFVPELKDGEEEF